MVEIAKSCGRDTLLAFTRTAAKDINASLGLAPTDRRVNSVGICMDVSGAIGRLAFDIGQQALLGIKVRSPSETKLRTEFHIALLAEDGQIIDPTFGQYLPGKISDRHTLVEAVLTSNGQDPVESGGALILPGQPLERIEAITAIASCMLPSMGSRAVDAFSAQLFGSYHNMEAVPFEAVSRVGENHFRPSELPYQEHIYDAADGLKYYGVIKRSTEINLDAISTIVNA